MALYEFGAKQGDEIMTIIPGDKNYYGNAKVQIAGSGKIKIGQKINIKFDNYPYGEYGIIEGSVQSISLIPKENTYNVTAQLLNGLLTSYGKKLEFKSEMSGQAEIITEDLRLIERFFTTADTAYGHVFRDFSTLHL